MICHCFPNIFQFELAERILTWILTERILTKEVARTSWDLDPRPTKQLLTGGSSEIHHKRASQRPRPIHHLKLISDQIIGNNSSAEWVIDFFWNDLTLHEAGGALKAPTEEKLRFWYIFEIQLIQKKFDFSQISMTTPPYSFGGSK